MRTFASNPPRTPKCETVWRQWKDAPWKRSSIQQNSRLTKSADQSRQPGPGARLAVFPTSLARRGCALRWPNLLRVNTRIIPSAVLAVHLSGLLLCGCGSQHRQQTVERVRSEVATILKKDSAQIDVAKPLVAQGADELDIVEIVMAVEEAFEVEIPDSAIGENVGEVSKTLTVQKLAEIVSRQQKSK